MKKKPRPICPKCCSAAVDVENKHAHCRRCNHVATVGYFLSNYIVGQPMQSASTEFPHHPRNLPENE